MSKKGYKIRFVTNDDIYMKDRITQGITNIKDEGLRIIGSSSPEFTLVDCPTMDDKREISLKSSDRLKQERNELHGYFL